MLMRFENKRVLVTGAGSGIGQATCLAFAKEGAAIAAADINLDAAQATVEKITNSGRKASAVQIDVTSPDSVKTAVESTLRELGGLNILVNSAGVREIVAFLELPFEEWQRILSVNLNGTFLCSQAAAHKMIAQGQGGKIVNLASVAGLVGVPNRAAYVSSKHAVVGLTKEMAMELAEHDIQVNAIAPGVVETGMTAGYFDDPNVVESVRKLHPARRWAQPEEIANLILFLSSAEAHFMTGATYPIDGGFMAGKSF
jgi:NAD(P)-dependent dehydrogenase (short-subunit alcohol dehydrogenase family)